MSEETSPSETWWNRKRSRRDFLKLGVKAGAGAVAVGTVGYHFAPDVLWQFAGPMPDGPLLSITPRANLIGPGYLHTEGSLIKDQRGRLVRIRGGNWGGAETEGRVPGMLHRFTPDEYVDQQIAEGFNAFRLPFCIQTVLNKDPKDPTFYADPKQIARNPGLVGATNLEVMDEVIAAAKRKGVKVIPDCHTITPHFGEEAGGVPFSDDYGFTRWLEALQLVAARYKGNDTVVGIELFNEPGRISFIAPWQYGGVWGGGGPRDLHALFTAAGNAVQNVNPDLLILIPGGWSDPAGPKMGPFTVPIGPGSNHSSWERLPVKLRNPNKAVITVHAYDWGWNPWQIPYLTVESPYWTFSVLDQSFGNLVRRGIVPALVTEFGTANGLQPGSHPARAYTDDDTPNSGGKSFSYHVDYIRQLGIGSFLWQNPAEKSPNFEPEYYAYLRVDGKGPASIPYANKIRAVILDDVQAIRSWGHHIA